MVMNAANDGLDAFVLSPTAIVGPMDFEPSLMGKAFLQLYHHQIPALVPGGYNWVDVRDIVEAAIYLNWKRSKRSEILTSRALAQFTGSSKAHWKAYKAKDCRDCHAILACVDWLAIITIYSKISGRTPLYTRESLKIIINCSKQISYEKAKRELGFQSKKHGMKLLKIQWNGSNLNGYLKKIEENDKSKYLQFNCLCVDWHCCRNLSFCSENYCSLWKATTNTTWGPLISNRAGWILMEITCIVSFFAVLFIFGKNHQ